MTSQEAVERIVLALERIADALSADRATQNSFRDLLEGVFNSDASSPSEPVDEPTLGVASTVEEPKVVDWYIDTADKDRPIMVRLSDGTTRRPTAKEAEKLK